ncbi:MAG: FtsL-like putative cell division protein [Chitinophagales bacterium]
MEEQKNKKGIGRFLQVFDIVEGEGFRSIVMSLPFVLFLVVLGFLHIANNHLAESYARQIARTDKQVRNLRWEYMETTNNLMKKSRLGEVAKLVEPYGLKELHQPPYLIEVKAEN